MPPTASSSGAFWVGVATSTGAFIQDSTGFFIFLLGFFIALIAAAAIYRALTRAGRSVARTISRR